MADTCSSCGKAISGAEILYTPDARPVCLACNDRVDVAAATARAQPAWMGLAVAGAVAGAIPFFVHVSASSSSSVNGHVTSFVYRDWIAVGCGIAAAVLGVLALAAGRKTLLRMQAIGAGLALVLFGGYQIANGLGVFANSSNASTTTESWSEPEPAHVVAPTAAPPALDPSNPATCADAEACFQLGVKLDKANDTAGANTAYERSCGLGAAGGCFNAGINAKERKPPDLVASFGWFDKGCKLGDSNSCNSVGQAYRNARGVPKDLAKAAAVFGDACEHGGALACLNLGGLLSDGDGVPADKARAFTLFAKACDLDDAENVATACTEAGVRALNGDGTTKDGAAATKYFRLACDRAAAECYNLAVISEHGTGVAKDLPGARALYRKACDAGNFDGCNNLGHLENDGLGGAKDHADAMTLFQKACDGGAELACKNLKTAK